MLFNSKGRKRESTLTLNWKMGAGIFSVTLLLLLVLQGVVKLKENQTFPIRAVKVFGVQHVDQKSMQQILTPLVTKGFFAVELESIKERVLQLPWIAETSIRRVWPDQIFITVKEHQPVARWNEHSLLSASGEIFTGGSGDTRLSSSFPQFIGPEGEQIQMLQYYEKMNGLLVPLHFRIARLEVTPFMSWSLVFDNGMKLNMGYKDVLTRIRHFVKVYPKIIGDRGADVEYIDLRYANGLAVRWKSAT